MTSRGPTWPRPGRRAVSDLLNAWEDGPDSVPLNGAAIRAVVVVVTRCNAVRAARAFVCVRAARRIRRADAEEARV